MRKLNKEFTKINILVTVTDPEIDEVFDSFSMPYLILKDEWERFTTGGFFSIAFEEALIGLEKYISKIYPKMFITFGYSKD